ncbi:MAG: class I SAM-dependent methyltransferase, partial [Alphaproteobacteria bacterium]|nr:class I SAM-dependent methyltransferase [Alphaproteobacteria bacterium]
HAGAGRPVRANGSCGRASNEGAIGLGGARARRARSPYWLRPGTTVLELAKQVGPGGHVLCADVSEASVARSRERIAAAGLRHAEVIVADASVHPFPPDSFELAFSRLESCGFGEVSLTPLDPVIQLAGPAGEAEAADFGMAIAH